MRNRITLEISKEEGDALDELATATGRSGRPDVIRDSLELYDLIVNRISEGKHLYLGSSPTEVVEVILPQLEKVLRRRQPTATPAMGVHSTDALVIQNRE
jgi:hypothetical protein